MLLCSRTSCEGSNCPARFFEAAATLASVVVVEEHGNEKQKGAGEKDDSDFGPALRWVEGIRRLEEALRQLFPRLELPPKGLLHPGAYFASRHSACSRFGGRIVR